MRRPRIMYFFACSNFRMRKVHSKICTIRKFPAILISQRERGSVVGVYVSSHRELIGAQRMLSQSSACSLLRWSCAHWLKRVASVLSDVPLSVATLRAESWAFITVLRSSRLRHVSFTWLLSPPLVWFRDYQQSPCCDVPTIGQLHM